MFCCHFYAHVVFKILIVVGGKFVARSQMTSDTLLTIIAVVKIFCIGFLILSLAFAQNDLIYFILTFRIWFF